VGDCSNAMTRDCFEPRSALLGSGSSALCRDDFVVGTRLALTPSVASLQTLTLRSSVRFRGVAPHHRSPTSAMEPAGQHLGAPLAPEINGQYRSNGRPHASPFWTMLSLEISDI
jgi:hypothetical protein